MQRARLHGRSITQRVRLHGRRVAVGAAAGGLLASGLVAVGVGAAGPANADVPLIACSWIKAGGLDNRENTTVCRGPGKKATVVIHRDCWKYQPPRNSFVRVKQGSKWFATGIRVFVRQVDSCPDSHPWLTRVKIPTEGIEPYDIQRYRLVMPAHEVEVDDTVVQVKRARLNMYVCMMNEDSDRTC